MRRHLRYALIAIALVAVAVSGLGWWRRVIPDRELDKELRLARAEGIPTSAAEFAATIPRAENHENAAPYYRKLLGLRRVGLDVGLADIADAVFGASPGSVARARAALSRNRQKLELVDQAILLPKCWFDRDWREGAAVVMPEFAEIKKAARLFALRGALSARQGHVDQALAQVRAMEVLSGHCRQETTAISALVGDSIHEIALQTLALWSMAYREERYVQAIEGLITRMPKADIKSDNRAGLHEILSMIELCSTKEGRASLGLAEEDIGAAEKIFQILIDRRKAKVDIVRQHRRIWKALDLPRKQRAAAIEEIDIALSRSLLAFPTAADVYASLSAGVPVTDRQVHLDRWKVQYQAVLRALRPKHIPSKIKTADLIDPEDGSELKYSFDGKQIRITLGPSTLKLPPDTT